MFTRVRCGRLFLLRATKCCILQGFVVFTCKSNNFQVGNLGGKLLVISRVLTVQRMAMCCGPSASSHGCHARGHGLGMDALVSVRSGNVNVSMVWAWMLWSAYALGTRTLLWFGHGCFGQRMPWEHKRYYGLGMDALVSVCPGNTNVIMVWAWMLWSAYVLGTQTLLWFGHGCLRQRMLSEHEQYSGY